MRNYWVIFSSGFSKLSRGFFNYWRLRFDNWWQWFDCWWLRCFRNRLRSGCRRFWSRFGDWFWLRWRCRLYWRLRCWLRLRCWWSRFDSWLRVG